MSRHRTIILGAGAAGLFAAARTGGSTLVLDHARRPAEKVRISGGGRCNFTNLDIRPEAYLSQNPHFAKSALARTTQWDIIEQVSRHGIAWHEKTLGQLFCDGSSRQIVDMLVGEAEAAGAEIRLSTEVRAVSMLRGRFHVQTSAGAFLGDNLIVATGGKSIPKMGATGLAYDIARQFGHEIVTPRPGLVPLTFGDRFAPLAGLSIPATVACNGARFSEGLLFTHRGLSGPAVLQASSWWHPGDAISIDLTPGVHLFTALRAQRQKAGRMALTTALSAHLPARLVDHLAPEFALAGRLADQSDARLRALAEALSDWRLKPTGSEGYRTAEVTVGGVSTEALSSKTMESAHQRGLYFIGEAVDVTGWLGGYNFQWAWSSAAAAAGAIAAA